MDLKNINRLLILLFSISILSCQTIDNFKNIEEFPLSTEINEMENIEKIDNTILINNNNMNIDNYSLPFNFLWQKEKKLYKVITINKSSTKYSESIPLNTLLLNDKIYSFDNDLNLKVYNLNDGIVLENYKVALILIMNFLILPQLQKSMIYFMWVFQMEK